MTVTNRGRPVQTRRELMELYVKGKCKCPVLSDHGPERPQTPPSGSFLKRKGDKDNADATRSGGRATPGCSLLLPSPGALLALIVAGQDSALDGDLEHVDLRSQGTAGDAQDAGRLDLITAAVAQHTRNDLALHQGP